MWQDLIQKMLIIVTKKPSYLEDIELDQLTTVYRQQRKMSSSKQICL
jgi:hypothetical protein